MSMRPNSSAVRATSAWSCSVTVTSVDGEGAPAEGAHLGRNRVDVGLRARRAHDVGTRFCERPGGPGTDALPGTGDDGDTTF
jgi:hypothetical protein